MNEPQDWRESEGGTRPWKPGSGMSVMRLKQQKTREAGEGNKRTYTHKNFDVCVYLWGVGDSERDHVLTGVFNEEVMLIQQLHLPHPQPPQLIKELEESDERNQERREPESDR